MDRQSFEKAVLSIQKIFEKKNPALMYVTLAQIYDSIQTQLNTLNFAALTHYFSKRPGIPIVIFWNGETDKYLLKRLGLYTVTLNMTTWDVYNDKVFYVRLMDNTDKTIIHESIVSIVY